MNEEQKPLPLFLKSIVVSAIVDDSEIEHARSTAGCKLDSVKNGCCYQELLPSV